MIVIGSTAIKAYFPDFKREPKDLDFAVESKEGLKNGDGVEYLYNPILFKEKWSKYISDGGEGKYYLLPTGMLTLKVSHLFWDTNWSKHMFDVQFLFDKGVEYDTELLDELIEFWTDYLPKIRRSNLEMSKEDFFMNAVNEDENEHDKLHEMLVDHPAYKDILKDNCEVELDENKWSSLSDQRKRDVVEEEAWVMQHERYDGKLHYLPAYSKQIKENIMKHYPKYIALYAIRNYKSFIKPPQHFVGKLNQHELQIN